jgi:hypothetical protein
VTLANRVSLIFAVVSTLSIAGAQPATVTTYDNEAAFFLSAHNLQTVDFEGLLAPGEMSRTFSTLILDGITFATQQREGLGPVDVVNSDLQPDNGRTYPPGNYVVMRSIYGATMLLPDGITALGLQLFSTDQAPASDGFLRVGLSTQGSTESIGAFSVPTQPSPHRSFLGVISDTAITRVLLEGQVINMAVAVDNVSFGQARALESVPEPSTIAMLSLGLLVTALWSAARISKEMKRQWACRCTTDEAKTIRPTNGNTAGPAAT